MTEMSKLPNGSENYLGIDTEKEHPVVAKSVRALAIGIDALVEFIYGVDNHNWSYMFRRSDGSALIKVNATLHNSGFLSYQTFAKDKEAERQKQTFHNLLIQIHGEFSK